MPQGDEGARVVIVMKHAEALDGVGIDDCEGLVRTTGKRMTGNVRDLTPAANQNEKYLQGKVHLKEVVIDALELCQGDAKASVDKPSLNFGDLANNHQRQLFITPSESVEGVDLRETDLISWRDLVAHN